MHGYILSSRGRSTVFLFALLTFLPSCKLTLLSTPPLIWIGMPATFTLQYDAAGGTGTRPSLVFLHPSTWQVLSVTYVGTINGSPAAGTAFPSSLTCASSAPEGYLVSRFTAGTLPAVLPSDSVVISVTFLVGGSPGSGTLSFLAGEELDCFVELPLLFVPFVALAPAPLPALSHASALAAALLLFLGGMLVLGRKGGV